MSKTIPRPPVGSGASGKALWRQVLERFELDEHERALLVEVVRTVDQLDQLAAAVRQDGVMVDGKPHPALVEARQQRAILARLVASLRLPEDGSEERPQHRGRARGTYGVRPVRSAS